MFVFIAFEFIIEANFIFVRRENSGESLTTE